MNSLLPQNATALEHEVAKLSARLDSLPDNIEILWDADRCPESFLPWLAWSLSVDEWDTNWSETQKRRTIKDSIRVHQIKGTPAAIKRALNALGHFDAQIVEGGGGFFMDGAHTMDGTQRMGDGNLHWADYQVYLSTPVTIREAANIRRLIDSVAPARSRLAELNFTQAQNDMSGTFQMNGSYAMGVA